MSYQEKKHIVSFLSTFLIFGLYCWYVFHKVPGTNTDTTETFHFWAAAILILIPVAIAAKIVVAIIFNIIYRITTKEKEPSFTDELDKLIELKATRNSHYVFVLGFLLAMVALVMDMTPSTMFIILFFSGFLSEMAGVTTQLYLYRKGV